MLSTFLFTTSQHRNAKKQVQKLEATVANRTLDLSSSEARYRSLVENLEEGIVIYDLQAEEVLFSNPAVHKICHCPVETDNPTNICIFERFHEDDRDQVRQQIANSLSDDRSVSDYQALTFDEQPIWLQLTCTRIEFDGRPCAMLMLVDITQRKQAESARVESEERFALAVAGAKDGIWDWDLRSNKLHVSPRWKAILGEQENPSRSIPPRPGSAASTRKMWTGCAPILTPTCGGIRPNWSVNIASCIATALTAGCKPAALPSAMAGKSPTGLPAP